MTKATEITFDIGISRLFPGEKLEGGDTRWGRHTHSFGKETHSIESLAHASAVEGFSIAPVVRNHHRKAENFISAQHLGLDFDQETSEASLEALQEDPFIADHAALIHETASSTPEKPRSRVIFILDQPITDPEEYRRASEALIWKFSGVDEHCKDAARLFFGRKNGRHVVLGNVLYRDLLQEKVIEPYLAQLSSNGYKLGLPIGDVLPQGQRNSTLTSLAGTMRERGMSETAMLAALQIVNAERCQPPIPDSEVADIARSVAHYTPSGNKRQSQASLLVELAQEVRELWHTPEEESFATIFVNGHYENWSLASQKFQQFISRQYYQRKETAPNSQAIKDALMVLKGKALFEGCEHPCYLRLAEHNGAIYLDLANENWEAVEITSNGWQIIADPPIKFRRAKGMSSLPYPARDGHAQDLRRFVNAKDEKDWILLLAWLIAAYRSQGPYPVLVLHGGQGSAKSTVARVLRELIDPNIASLRSEPRENRDIAISANNGWVIALDNLSRLPSWLSDVLCRLSTGGAFATRSLYTDAEEVLFEAQRPVTLNGIEELVERGDLLDRSVVLFLPAISEDDRLLESEFWEDFRATQPGILGALLNAVSMALRRYSEIDLPSLPRLADFAQWVTAAEPALHLEPGSFLEAYTGNRDLVNDLALEVSPIGPFILSMVRKDSWEGTASNLLKVLNNEADEEVQRLTSWPVKARSLSNILRRLAPNLRAQGVEVEFSRTAQERQIALRRIDDAMVSEEHGLRHPIVTENHIQNDANDANDDDFSSFTNEEKGGRDSEGEESIRKVREFCVTNVISVTQATNPHDTVMTQTLLSDASEELQQRVTQVSPQFVITDAPLTPEEMALEEFCSQPDRTVWDALYVADGSDSFPSEEGFDQLVHGGKVARHQTVSPWREAL